MSLLCHFLGHDFRRIQTWDDARGYTHKVIYPSNYCRRCGADR